jgi:hypothetical protein
MPGRTFPSIQDLSPTLRSAYDEVFYAMGEYLAHVPLDGTSRMKPIYLNVIRMRLNRAKASLHRIPETAPIIAAIDKALAVVGQFPLPVPCPFTAHLQDALRAFASVATPAVVALR